VAIEVLSVLEVIGLAAHTHVAVRENPRSKRLEAAHKYPLPKIKLLFEEKRPLNVLLYEPRLHLLPRFDGILYIGLQVDALAS
jgi:hypothetical protein